MSKHTAGAWYYRIMDGDPNSDRHMFYVQSGESEICGGAVGNLSSKDPDEQEANARLISAAPDLLAALEELYNLLEEHQDDAGWYTNGHYKRARNAILKAISE